MRHTILSFTAVALIGYLFPTSASAAANPTRRALNQTLPELKFDGVSFADALDFLRDVSGANISVNWKAVNGIGVTADQTVNLRLRQVSLRKALALLLGEVGGGDTLTYDVDEGVIDITTRELADHRMITRVYPIEDLIMEIPDFTDAPQFSLDAAANQGQGGGGGGGAGGSGGGGQVSVANSLFANGANQTTTSDPGKSKTERAQDLIDLIENLISSDVWKENGGPASIRYFNGNLVVTAPRSVQEAIGGDFD
jgi:hypothetical protein